MVQSHTEINVLVTTSWQTTSSYLLDCSSVCHDDATTPSYSSKRIKVRCVLRGPPHHRAKTLLLQNGVYEQNCTHGQKRWIPHKSNESSTKTSKEQMILQWRTLPFDPEVASKTCRSTSHPAKFPSWQIQRKQHVVFRQTAACYWLHSWQTYCCCCLINNFLLPQLFCPRERNEQHTWTMSFQKSTCWDFRKTPKTWCAVSDSMASLIWSRKKVRPSNFTENFPKFSFISRVMSRVVPKACMQATNWLPENPSQFVNSPVSFFASGSGLFLSQNLLHLLTRQVALLYLFFMDTDCHELTVLSFYFKGFVSNIFMWNSPQANVDSFWTVSLQ